MRDEPARQVSEGWHGVRFDPPLGRTREYVEVVRMALHRRTVAYAGDHFTLPLPNGPGKALKLTLPPGETTIPIDLAALGPMNLSSPVRWPMAGWQRITEMLHAYAEVGVTTLSVQPFGATRMCDSRRFAVSARR